MPKQRTAWARYAAGAGLVLGVVILLLLVWLDAALFATLGHPKPPPLPGLAVPLISPAWRTIILANGAYGGGAALILAASLLAWRQR
jgi:hypothetical protein